MRCTGSSLLLTSDSLRARYREDQREEKLIDTQEPLLYKFEHFTFTSRLLTRGSRLRLVIGPVHSIYAQRNFNRGEAVAEESAQDARTVTVRLFHDATHRSVLQVSIAADEA